MPRYKCNRQYVRYLRSSITILRCLLTLSGFQMENNGQITSDELVKRKRAHSIGFIWAAQFAIDRFGRLGSENCVTLTSYIILDVTLGMVL